MSRRTKTEWRSLIEQQQASGLSAAAFCRQHQLNPKYFSSRKHALSLRTASFVKMAPNQSSSSEHTSIAIRVIELSVPWSQLDDALSRLLSN